MPISFGNNTNIGSAKYVPYLYDRIKSIVLSFINNSEILVDVDNILIPCEADGSNPVFTNSDNTVRVFYGGINQTSNWTIDVLSETNVTTTQVDNTISITAISADEGEYTVRAVRSDYSTITEVVKVYKAKLSGEGLDGLGWTGGSYNSSNGIVTFTSDDGLGFQTGDLRGQSGGGTTQESNYSIHPVLVDGSIGIVALGDYSIDLQSLRTDASEAAIGNYSVIGGGIGNSNDGLYGVVSGGLGNDINNSGYESNSIGGGNVNSITGTASGSTIPGGIGSSISAKLCSAVGSYSTLNNEASSSIGIGGESTTNGELIQSFSDSPIQKSTFMLEGTTASTTPTTLESLGRANFFGATPQSIQMSSDTVFSGKLTLVGSETGIGRYYMIRHLSFTCDNGGNIVGLTDQLEYSYTSGGTNGVISYITTTLNQLEIQVTDQKPAGNPTNWACMVEGIIIDR